MMAMVITKRMTWDEIRARYPDQWVIMVDHDWPGDRTAISTARILACGAERSDALLRARPALESYECYGCRFTGELPRLPVRYRPRHAGDAGDAENLTARTSLKISGAVTPGERLTWSQIRERYPDRWVVMVDHDWQEPGRTGYNTARVLASGATRAEAMERGRPALEPYRGYGCRYTGTVRGPMFQLKQFEIDR